jgi:tetratricopeptide (TPR) repeat protein
MIGSRKQIGVVAGLIAVVFLPGCSRTPEEKYARFVSAGKKRLEAREFGQAALEFQNAIQMRPKDAEPYYQLGLAYLSADRVKEAVLALRKATEVDPKHAAAQLKLVELMIRTRNERLTKDAEARIHTVLTTDPSDNDALFMLAATQAQLGKPEDAEKYLSEVLARSPQHLKSAIAMAQLKLSQRNFTGAEEVLKKAVELAPKSSDTIAALGTLYAVTGRLAEAEVQLRKAIALDPKNAGALTSLGSTQMAAGNKAEAERTYKQIAALPQNEHRLAYAIFLMQENRRPDAIAELERLAKARPEDRIARSALVVGYLAANRPAEAEKILDAALKKNARDTEALLQRGQIYLQNGSKVLARRDLDEVLRFDPSAQAHYLKAKLYRAEKQTLEQQKELAEALRLAPDSLRVRLAYVDALLATDDARTALRVLEAAPAGDRRTLAYLIAHNWALIGSGEIAGARRGVDQALAVRKTSDVLVQDGMLRFAAQDYVHARASLEEALKSDPENMRALVMIVQTYVAQKQPGPATERIKQAVAQKPASEPLQLLWAEWLVENKLPDQARKALDAAKAAAPKSATPQLMAAGLYFSQGKLDDARRELEQLLSAEPSNLDAHMLLGELEDAKENYAAAAEHYKKVLSGDERNPGALNNLAYALSRDSQQLDGALRYAQKAKELAPENSQILDTLGWIYYRKGLFVMAARELEGAVAKDPRPALQYHLGLAYNQVGKSLEGARLIAAALAVDPRLAQTVPLQ